MKIYLAARYRRIDEMREYAEELKKEGHEITSRWVYGGEEGKTFDEIAVFDLEDVEAADAFVTWSEEYGTEYSGGGRHTELGVAISLGKKVVLVGPREQIFHWHPTVKQFPRFEYAKRYLSVA